MQDDDQHPHRAEREEKDRGGRHQTAAAGGALPDGTAPGGWGGVPPWSVAVLVLLAAALLGQRLLHLRGPIDDPHSWRQCDEACFIWAFYDHGIDLLHPSVCWMGGHRTLLLVFPIAEAAVALLYRWLSPDLLWARLVHLAAFLGAAVALRGIVGRIGGRRLGDLAALLFLALPLGIFYSRAVHVDFVPLALGYAMAWAFLVACDARRPALVAAATAAATLGFLVKAPYVFPLFLPLAHRVWSRRDGFGARALVALAGVPTLAFAAWRAHVERVNAAAPDWSFLPGYFKFVDMGWWYYGPAAMRLDPAAWWTLAERAATDVAGPIGLAAAAGGLILARRSRAWPFLAWWLAGVAVYVVVFFNVNVVHDYYQIPLLGPVAAFAALLVDAIAARLARRGPAARGAAVAALCAAVAASGVWLAETRYYGVDELRVAAGRSIERATPAGALIIASMPDSDARDPRLLCRARREGWAVATSLLEPGLVERLRGEGARHLAVVHPAGDRESLAWIAASYPTRTIALDPPWVLSLADLSPGVAHGARLTR